ncbi:hypothetical protein FOC4_g10002966 [Fusarium odoratissimum]|uniref:Uncharacterized protein n=3 Tax=Fusarium oxysporum species complex TaxID=171631 RepID=N1SBQ9_FUSC4|nr:hypothetical protein FOC4_g10002966 [Fusarium odoratissimum]
MHLALLLSLAFGLESVVASPCKPQSSTIATTTTTTETLGLSSTWATDTTKATEQSDSTTTTSLAISESTFSSSVSSSALLSDTTALSEQMELTGTTTIAISESTSVADLGSTTLVASSDISVTTSTEVTTTVVSESSISTSAELTSSVDASVTTSAAASTTTTIESTTDSTVSLTQISTDTTLEARTTTTTESPTSTTIVDEVSTSTAKTTTALLPIPTLFSLTVQGGAANGLVLHTNGQPEYSVMIGAFLTWPTGQFKYEEGTGHILVDGNPLCTVSYQGNFDFVSVIVCPTTLSFYHAPLVCDRPTGSSLKCSVAAKLFTCITDNGGTRTCTTTDVSWSNMYSAPWVNGVYQLRFAAADWAHDSTVNPIGLLVSPF